MDDLYKQLGFKQPAFLMNPYGIRIYIGAEGGDDWCVVIPKELVKLKNSCYNYDQDYTVYFVTEREALEIARMYTELAKNKGE